MSSKDVALIVALFFGVAASFIGIGLHTHGHRLAWPSIAAGAALVLVAYRGLRK